MADTGCGKNKILKCLKELEEDVRLIERKKQGQGRPDMIYVKNFAIEEVADNTEKDSEVCNVKLKEFMMETLIILRIIILVLIILILSYKSIQKMRLMGWMSTKRIRRSSERISIWTLWCNDIPMNKKMYRRYTI